MWLFRSSNPAETLFDSTSSIAASSGTDMDNTESNSKVFHHASRVFDSDLIFIRVGKEQKELSVHRNALTTVPYFAKCLNPSSGFTEARTKTIEFKEFRVDAFTEFLRHIYSGLCPDIRSDPYNARMTQPGRFILKVRVFILADYFGSEEIMNSCTDRIVQYCLKYKTPLSAIALLTKSCPTSMLRKFLITSVARRMNDSSSGIYTVNEAKTSFEVLFKKALLELNVQDVADICEESSVLSVRRETDRYYGRPTIPPDSGCTWHTHKITKKCS